MVLTIMSIPMCSLTVIIYTIKSLCGTRYNNKKKGMYNDHKYTIPTHKHTPHTHNITCKNVTNFQLYSKNNSLHITSKTVYTSYSK